MHNEIQWLLTCVLASDTTSKPSSSLPTVGQGCAGARISCYGDDILAVTLVGGPDEAELGVRRSWRRLAQRWEYLARRERLQWLPPMGRQPARSRTQRVLQAHQSRNSEQLHAWAPL